MSLRIRTPGSEGGGRRDGEDYPAVSVDHYMSRLVKLIPGEAIMVFPFLNSRAIEVAELSRQEAVQKLKQAGGLDGGLAAEPAAGLDAAPSGAADAAAGFFSSPVSNDVIMIAVAWLILVVVILLRWQATREGNGPAQWGAVLIAAVSFVLWVPVMGGSFGLLDTVKTLTGINWTDAVQRFIPELLLVLWTILIPAFYRPEN